ncbi:MAG: hypothetical protein AB1733_10325 [Thermodesulfobacteriota bacterium]
METRAFRVDSRMILPIVMAMIFGALLVALEASTRRGILLAVLLAPFFYLGAEILARKIVIDSQGITISKLFRSVRHDWMDLSSVDSVRTGNKVFVILHSDQGGTSLISNTIRPFGQLVDTILACAPQRSFTEEVRERLSDPPGKFGPLVQAWIACLALGALVVGTLLGYS